MSSARPSSPQDACWPGSALQSGYPGCLAIYGCRNPHFTPRISGNPLLDYEGTGQLLFSSHLRERDKTLLRSILCGGVWNGFLLGKTKEDDVLCPFCGGADGNGHLFWDCPFHLQSVSLKIGSLLLLRCMIIVAMAWMITQTHSTQG